MNINAKEDDIFEDEVRGAYFDGWDDCDPLSSTDKYMYWYNKGKKDRIFLRQGIITREDIPYRDKRERF